MTKILADDLASAQVSALVTFIVSETNADVTQRGKTIIVIGLTNRKLKFLLRKFLHTKHLSEFGVLDTGGTFETVHIKPEARRIEKSVTLKHPVPYGPPIPCAVKPILRIEWQGKPPPKKGRFRNVRR